MTIKTVLESTSPSKLIRCWIAVTCSLVMGIFGGCDFADRNQTALPDNPTVSTVPLRIVSAASDELNSRIELAWKAVSEQPIEITRATGDKLLEESASSDVIIFRNHAMGDLQARSALTSAPDAFKQTRNIDYDGLLEGLRNDTSLWGPESFAFPLGAVYPAVWYQEDVQLSEPLDWDEFQAVLQSVEKGQAAEPLAEGWGAISFLWRAATYTREMWLFDRQTIQPVINSEPYVRALEAMVLARETYPDQLLTPAEVWSGLVSGRLKIGIGWPTTSVSASQGGVSSSVSGSELGQIKLSAYPMSSEIFLGEWVKSDGQGEPIVVSPTGLSVAVASSCRQTAVARQFIGWLIGGEGHASIRGPSGEVLPIRVINSEAGDAEPSQSVLAVEAERAMYDAYVVAMQTSAAVRPALRIERADEYLSVLDRNVLAALSKEKSPRDALNATAEEWSKLTAEVGKTRQLNNWRQSQGMRER